MTKPLTPGPNDLALMRKLHAIDSSGNGVPIQWCPERDKCRGAGWIASVGRKQPKSAAAPKGDGRRTLYALTSAGMRFVVAEIETAVRTPTSPNSNSPATPAVAGSRI